MATTTTTLKRHVLEDQAREKTIHLLQKCLVDLIDLGLQCKQAHWNLVGRRFYSFHRQLDKIVESAREASDEFAERIAALDGSPDGRASTLASESTLDAFPEGRQNVDHAVTLIADRLANVIGSIRKGIDELEDVDLVSQDMLIQTAGDLEKHLWMVQAQEEE